MEYGSGSGGADAVCGLIRRPRGGGEMAVATGSVSWKIYDASLDTKFMDYVLRTSQRRRKMTLYEFN